MTSETVTEGERHHDVFGRFNAFSGNVPLAFDVDFIGSRIDYEMVSTTARRRSSEFVRAAIPPIGEEYFEWVDVLEAVSLARDSFTMLELGAGYGRWIVRAALAARQRGISRLRFGAVEAEPVHVQWLKKHLANNGVPLDSVDIFDGVVSSSPGKVYFHVLKPEGSPNNNPADWYGQAKAKPTVKVKQRWKLAFYHGHRLVTFRTGAKAIKVRQYSSKEIIERYDHIDLLDMDVQGEELEVVKGAMSEINARVKRLHIGTHGRDLEDGLFDLLSANGWECLNNFPLQRTSSTPYGDVAFADGVQTWINPSLVNS